jgi:hypothetical protein
MSVVVVGKDKVEAAITGLAGPEMDARIGLGLKAWGQVIQTAARENLHGHHFTGRAEQSTTVSEPSTVGNTIGVTVGIHGGLAPEGRPLEFGWSSATGKQPPTAPIVEWLTGSSQGAAVLSAATGAQVNRKKGFIVGARAGRLAASDESKAQGLAFVIARNIGRRGFSFGPLHWLSKAAAETVGQGKAALLRTVKR